MLPPEFLAELCSAICKGGLNGPSPESLFSLAELTDRQIVEIFCKPSQQGNDHCAPFAEPILFGPHKKSDDYAQFMAIGESLMQTRGANGDKRAKFTREDLQRHWDSRNDRAKARGQH